MGEQNLDMNKKIHHAIDELNTIHSKMKDYYCRQEEVEADKNKALQMELYLRDFKELASERYKSNLGKQIKAQRMLELKGMNEILDAVQQATGSKYLFNMAHGWDDSNEIAKQYNADDVFEAQLYELLQKAGEYSLKKNSKNLNLGISIMGRTFATPIPLEDRDIITDVTKQAIVDMMNSIPGNAIEQQLQESEIYSEIVAATGKTDVTGYNKTINIKANVKSKWQDFIKTFQGVRFSLKNYSSKSTKHYAISLGNTNPYKAFYGVLSSLGFQQKEISHIYIHSRISYFYNHTVQSQEGFSRILQIRFAYELSGVGLYDLEGNKLDAVDFLIYNDPATENIFVRSTKEIIHNRLKQDLLETSNIGNPWNNEIMIAKSYFT